MLFKIIFVTLNIRDCRYYVKGDDGVVDRDYCVHPDLIVMSCSGVPQYLGVLYVATAGQNGGGNLGGDEEEIVVMGVSIVQREGKKVSRVVGVGGFAGVDFLI